MAVNETLKTLRYAMRDHLVNRPNRARLENHGFTIIANDCVGGMIYRDLKECFNSPTINMFFSATDYLKFISAPQAYLDLPMQEVKDGIHFYKMAKIGNAGGGLVLHLVHYKTVEEAQEKWNTRKKRIDWNNAFYIFNDRNGCTQKDLEEFDALPYPHKIVFTHILHPEIKCAVKVPNCENKPQVPVMTAYKKGSLVRREYDCFDYVGWINQTS